MNASELRFEIYRSFAETGAAPSPAQLAAWCGGEGAAEDALVDLHEAHALVLDSDGSIRMALPFSAVDTGHTVLGSEMSWWANCAWDTLAIPAALDIDADIEATWLDTGEPVELRIESGQLNSTEGFIHFEIPARRWWDDIVET